VTNNIAKTSVGSRLYPEKLSDDHTKTDARLARARTILVNLLNADESLALQEALAGKSEDEQADILERAYDWVEFGRKAELARWLAQPNLYQKVRDVVRDKQAWVCGERQVVGTLNGAEFYLRHTSQAIWLGMWVLGQDSEEIRAARLDLSGLGPAWVFCLDKDEYSEWAEARRKELI
jgi:hypothetical protein